MGFETQSLYVGTGVFRAFMLMTRALKLTTFQREPGGMAFKLQRLYTDLGKIKAGMIRLPPNGCAKVSDDVSAASIGESTPCRPAKKQLSVPSDSPMWDPIDLVLEGDNFMTVDASSFEAHLNVRCLGCWCDKPCLGLMCSIVRKSAQCTMLQCPSVSRLHPRRRF